MKPNETERGQWYFQRYVAHLPTQGEIVLFDRSWYNRAGVELVMGFCTPNEYLEFTRQAPGMERSLIQSGIRMFKIWLAVGRKEQLKRLEARRKDPLKHWKLSPMDIEAIDKWDDYTAARDRMFYYTHTPEAPWTVVRSDDKKRARLNIMRLILSQLPYTDKDEDVVGTLDPKIVGAAAAIVPQDDAFLFGGGTRRAGQEQGVNHFAPRRAATVSRSTIAARSPACFHQLADQLDRAELRVGDVEAGRVGEEVVRRAALDRPVDAQPDSVEERLQLPAAVAEGADVADRGHGDFDEAVGVGEGLGVLLRPHDVVEDVRPRLLARVAVLVGGVLAADPREAEVFQHRLHVLAPGQAVGEPAGRAEAGGRRRRGGS